MAQLQSVAHATEPGMTCSQATGVARRALLKLGYTISTVEPAKAGAPGKVVGLRHSGYTPYVPESDDVYTTVVQVQCSDNGSEFQALSNESFFQRMDLRKAFASAINAMGERKVDRPRVKTAPDLGLLIAVEPQRGRQAGAEFGADLSASGITPVQVKIENRTERTYSFQRDQVTLVTQEGKRMDALDPAAIGGRLGDGLRAQLEQKSIHEGQLAPGATLQGFLYFPVSTYHRATIVLLDLASEEPEGFTVEF